MSVAGGVQNRRGESGADAADAEAVTVGGEEESGDASAELVGFEDRERSCRRR